MVVVANELINSYSSYSKGVIATEDTIDLGLISKVGHGGHHLNEKNTLKKFKKEVWYPEYYSRKMKNDDESQIMTMMVEKIKYIMENHEIPALPEDVLNKIDKIYEDYKDRIYKKELAD
ncbi:hypothetical protein SDC9_195688 [bioreactor metagenome]|uniref:Uncharacterized protein n=1 Tax=bioreactor metagenome TaxID=1076179 RepID=A0A645IIE6_9ZZZZ